MKVRPTITTAGAAAIALAALLGIAGGSARADTVRSGISSPLRAGSQPGCRWVLGAAKTIRVCDAKKVCQIRTVPAQRIWACGTVRD